MGALGGRAAEEVIFGEAEVTTGASNDLQQVTSMARQMVTRFGMSDIGPLCLENETTNPFLGRSMNSNTEYSDEVAIKIDNQVKQIVDACHQKAIEIIKDNRVIIDYLVDLLIEEETIDGSKFRQIVNEYTSIPEKYQISV